MAFYGSCGRLSAWACLLIVSSVGGRVGCSWAVVVAFSALYNGRFQQSTGHVCMSCFMLDMLCSALMSAKCVKQRPGGGYLTRCVSVVNPENTALQEKAHFKKSEHIKKDYNSL